MALMLLDVVTPSKQVIHREVDEVCIPGILGEFGVLPQHTPFMTTLNVGTLRVRRDHDERKYVINGGYAEVSGDHIIILTESCEMADEIDLARAKKALVESEKILMEMDASTAQYQEASDRAKRARARVEVAEGRDF